MTAYAFIDLWCVRAADGRFLGSGGFEPLEKRRVTVYPTRRIARRDAAMPLFRRDKPHAERIRLVVRAR